MRFFVVNALVPGVLALAILGVSGVSDSAFASGCRWASFHDLWVSCGVCYLGHGSNTRRGGCYAGSRFVCEVNGG